MEDWLYTATVATFIQILKASREAAIKAELYFGNDKYAADNVINARLIYDMHSYSFQVKSMCAHSAGAIESLTKGVFTPDQSCNPENFAEVRLHIDAAIEKISSFTKAKLKSYEGKKMIFIDEDYSEHFTAQSFLLKFSVPNFYFHATTVYNILRAKGLPIGKSDFIGSRSP